MQSKFILKSTDGCTRYCVAAVVLFMEEFMLLYFVRHGETVWNAEGRLQGEMDVPLNERGILLAKLTGEGLKEVSFDLAISSPLSRAADTAQIILGERKIPLILEPRIQEIRWGVWEGLCAGKDNFEIPDKEFHKFYTDPFHFKGAPGGETIIQVCKRTGEFYHELISNKQYRDKTILISTHGCAVRGILNKIYPDPGDFWQSGVPVNCAVNIVKVEEKSMFIKKDMIFYDQSYVRDSYHLVEDL